PVPLADLIDANPKAKFAPSRGGHPRAGETGAIATKYPTRVWVDSCRLPTISYHAAKRAFREWLGVGAGGPGHVGGRRHPRRGDLRGDRAHPPVPRRGARRADRPRGAGGGAREADRAAGPARRRAATLPA